jgi:hypothetical protein
MLYRIIGEEIATHRHVEIPNWDAPDIATARRLATQIGIVISRIEPTNTSTPGARDDVGRNAPAIVDANRLVPRNSDAVCNVTLEGPRIATIRPQAILITLGLLLAVTLLAIGGIVAWQAINTVGSRSEATFQRVADRLATSTPDATPAATPDATPYTTVAATVAATRTATKTESKPQTSRQDLIDAGANVLKEIQQLRERWEERAVKTVGTLRAHYERFRITFTEDQSNLLQRYIKRFEELDAEGMAQFTAIENGSLEPTSIRIRLRRITQLDKEWKETGKEFARQGREAGLQ